MNNLIAQRQGQPVLFLCLLAAGWLLLRVLTWDNPWNERAILSEPFLLAGETISAPYTGPGQAEARDTQLSPAGTGRSDHPDATVVRQADQKGATKRGRTTDDGTPSLSGEMAASGDAFPKERFLGSTAIVADPRPGTPDRAGAHAGGIAALPIGRSAQASNWRIDAWLVLREGSPRPADGGLRPPSYGGSQVGAVLSYRLAAASAHKPAAYFRANRAIGADGETDTALGLRARALEHIPIDIHVEARVTHRPGSTEIRPAAFAAGGFDRLDLPMNLKARGYGQAGYVSGDFATAFADGAVVAEREAARLGPARLSVGGGMWAGAQKDASRLDVGPTVTIDAVVAKAPIRLEAGYRLRVAGNAVPGNSGVLTLSTGF